MYSRKQLFPFPTKLVDFTKGGDVLIKTEKKKKEKIKKTGYLIVGGVLINTEFHHDLDT